MTSDAFVPVHVCQNMEELGRRHGWCLHLGGCLSWAIQGCKSAQVTVGQKGVARKARPHPVRRLRDARRTAPHCSKASDGGFVVLVLFANIPAYATGAAARMTSA